MSRNISITKCTIGCCSGGIRTPQIQMQFTPLYWQLSFVFQRTDGIPNKVGFGIGPLAIVAYFGPASFENGADFSTHTALAKKKPERGRQA